MCRQYEPGMYRLDSNSAYISLAGILAAINLLLAEGGYFAQSWIFSIHI